MTPFAYPIAEAARVGVSSDTLGKAIYATEPPYLRAKRVGNNCIVPVESLADWLDRLPDA